MAEPPPRSCGEAARAGPGLPAAPPRPAGGSGRERPAGGAPPEAAAGSESGSGEKKADPEQVPEPPGTPGGSERSVGARGTAGAAVRRRSREDPSPGKSPRRPSPWKSSAGKNQASRSFNVSPGRVGPSPQAKRRSWRRSSLKGTKRRKSLPPVHRDVTELSRSISLELPEDERLAELLLASFQFTAQELERVLKQNDGFNPEVFHANALEESIAQIKEHMARFTAECRSWDQLLQRYQESAEEMSRQLAGCQRDPGTAELPALLQSSQAAVLGSKPDYQRVLEEQGEVFSCMELVLDELQQALKVLETFSEDSQQYLRCLSRQLASRTFRQLENSPVRKLIAGPPRRTLPPEG
ncbi:kinetochore-associated protein DSN1 homolog [Aegotheles albertisi]